MFIKNYILTNIFIDITGPDTLFDLDAGTVIQWIIGIRIFNQLEHIIIGCCAVRNCIETQVPANQVPCKTQPYGHPYSGTACTYGCSRGDHCRPDGRHGYGKIVACAGESIRGAADPVGNRPLVTLVTNGHCK